MFTMSRIHRKSPRATAATVALVLAVTASLALAAFTLLPGLVTGAHVPIHPEPLTGRAVFTDDVSMQIKNKLDGKGTTVLNMPDASRTLVVKFTVQPGAQFPWHTHPGPVIVTIQQGTLIYTLATDCIDRSYPAGTAFVDPGGTNVHTAHNPSDSVETILYATFFDFPAEGLLSIPDANQNHCGTSGGSMGGH